MDSSKLTGGPSMTATGNCADDDGETANTEKDKVMNVTHIIGGDGDDSLTGGAADDILEGGLGDDTLIGGLGNDSLYGDAGDDTLEGDEGDDYLDSGAHTVKDTLDGDNASTSSDGDVCLYNTGDTVTRCEL
jgi:Ca2+-binding RTX toxin-like protein